MSDFFSLFFCTMEMFCLGVYFILAHRRAENSEGTAARSSVWCSTLRFIHLTRFLSDVVGCFFLYKKRKKTGGRNCSDSAIEMILSQSYWEHDLRCQAKAPTARHITSRAPRGKSSAQVTLSLRTAGGASNMRGFTDEPCKRNGNKFQSNVWTVLKVWWWGGCHQCCTVVIIVVCCLVWRAEQKRMKRTCTYFKGWGWIPINQMGLGHLLAVGVTQWKRQQR